MKFAKKKTVLIILMAIILLGIASISYSYYKKDSSVSGFKVINIIQKPNQAEDGYYGIELRDSSGQKYTIDATGYLNNPAGPDYFGEACINVPDLKVGQEIEFNLPRSQYEDKTFNICFKKGSGDYFIRLK